ncbi:MAG: hypothetical protein ACI4DU_11210 [Lachnospiraceae bacterium]
MDGLFGVVKHMIMVALIGELILYLNPSVIYEKFLRILLELIIFFIFLAAIWNGKSTNGNVISYNLMALQEQMEEKMQQMDSAILRRQENLADLLLDNMLGIQENKTQENPAAQERIGAEENPAAQERIGTEENPAAQENIMAEEPAAQ